MLLLVPFLCLLTSCWAMPQHCVAHMWVIRRLIQLALSPFIYHCYSFLSKFVSDHSGFKACSSGGVSKGHLDQIFSRGQMKVNLHRPNITNQSLEIFIEKPSAFLGILFVTVNYISESSFKHLFLSLFLWTNTNISWQGIKNWSQRTWLGKHNFCENSLFAISRKAHTFKAIQYTPCWVYCCFTFLIKIFWGTKSKTQT